MRHRCATDARPIPSDSHIRAQRRSPRFSHRTSMALDPAEEEP
jgi:hypothetical protein